MSNAKVLFLLLSLVVFINYINYLMPDRDKLHKRIELLSYKIDKEKKLNEQKLDAKELQLPLDILFYDGKKFNYSQAMGDFQESINSAAEDVCTLKYIKWAQVPLSTKWYDLLKINTSLECTPKNMFFFINKLRKNTKLYNIKNFTIYKMRNKPLLQINMQLIAYRVHHEK